MSQNSVICQLIEVNWNVTLLGTTSLTRWTPLVPGSCLVQVLSQDPRFLALRPSRITAKTLYFKNCISQSPLSPSQGCYIIINIYSNRVNKPYKVVDYKMKKNKNFIMAGCIYLLMGAIVVHSSHNRNFWKSFPKLPESQICLGLSLKVAKSRKRPPLLC